MCGHVFEIGDVYVDGAGSFGWPDRVKGLAEPLEAKYRLYAVSKTGATVLLSVAMIRGHNNERHNERRPGSFSLAHVGPAHPKEQRHQRAAGCLPNRPSAHR